MTAIGGQRKYSAVYVMWYESEHLIVQLYEYRESISS